MTERVALRILIDRARIQPMAKQQLLAAIDHLSDEHVTLLGRYFAENKRQAIAKLQTAIVNIQQLLKDIQS